MSGKFSYPMHGSRINRDTILNLHVNGSIDLVNLGDYEFFGTPARSLSESMAVSVIGNTRSTTQSTSIFLNPPTYFTLANARTAYYNTTTIAWTARSLFNIGGIIYAVILDISTTKIRIYRSTDGVSFIEQDSSNALSHAGTTVCYDANVPLSGSFAGLIHVAYQPSSGTARIRTFDTTTNTWATTDIGNANAATVDPTTNMRVAVRSDGDVFLAYKSGTTSSFRRYEGAGWTGTTTLETSGSVLDAVVTDNSDMIHFFAVDSSTKVWQKSFDATNVAGTNTQAGDASTTLSFAGFHGYVNDSGTFRIAEILTDTGGESDFYYGTSGSTITFSTVASAIPATTVNMGQLGGAIVPYNNQWWIIYSGDGSAAVRVTHSNAYAATSFVAADNSLVGLSGNDPAVYAVPTSTGIVALYSDFGNDTVGAFWPTGAPEATRSLSQTASISTNTTFTRNLGQLGSIQITSTRSLSESVAITSLGLTRSLAQKTAITTSLSRTVGQLGSITTTNTRPLSESASITTSNVRSLSENTAITLLGIPRTLSQNTSIQTTVPKSLTQFVSLSGASGRSLSQSVAVLITKTESLNQSTSVSTTSVRNLSESTSVSTVNVKSLTEKVSVGTTNTRSLSENVAVLTTNVRSLSQSGRLFVTNVSTLSQSSAISAVVLKTLGQSVSVTAPASRGLNQTVAIKETLSRSVGESLAISTTNTRGLSQQVSANTVNTRGLSQHISIATIGNRTSYIGTFSPDGAVLTQSASIQSVISRSLSQEGRLSETFTNTLLQFGSVNTTNTNSLIQRTSIGSSVSRTVAQSAAVLVILKTTTYFFNEQALLINFVERPTMCKLIEINLMTNFTERQSDYLLMEDNEQAVFTEVKVG